MFQRTQIIRVVLVLLAIWIVLYATKLTFVNSTTTLILVGSIGAITTTVLIYAQYKFLKTGNISDQNGVTSKTENPGWYWYTVLSNFVIIAFLSFFTFTIFSYVK